MTGMLGQPMPESLFGFLLDLEVRKAFRLRYCVSVVCIAPDVHPHDVAPEYARYLGARATQQLRTIDSVTMLRRDALGILLIDADPSKLPLILNRLMKDLCAHPMKASGHARRPTWSAGGSSYPATAHNKGELLEQAVSLMLKAKKDGGNRSYIPGGSVPTLPLGPSAL